MTVVELQRPAKNSGRALGPQYQFESMTIHRKPSGKVLTETALIGRDARGQLICSPRAEVPLGGSKDDTERPDPTADLSFELGLTEQQRKAKADVALPYTLPDARKTAQLDLFGGGGGGGGQIHYEADDADDFDEEDPDDDLGI